MTSLSRSLTISVTFFFCEPAGGIIVVEAEIGGLAPFFVVDHLVLISILMLEPDMFLSMEEDDCILKLTKLLFIYDPKGRALIRFAGLCMTRDYRFPAVLKELETTVALIPEHPIELLFLCINPLPGIVSSRKQLLCTAGILI
jgi:hypothetical protein